MINIIPQYLIKIDDYKQLDNLKYLFKDIRFYMGKSVLDGLMGTAYVENVNKPKFALLLVRSYCFISGKISKELLKKIIWKLRDYKFIPDDSNKQLIEELFKNNITSYNRYAFHKEVNFAKDKLEYYINKLDKKYKIIDINEDMAILLKKIKFINITDNYKEKGIGCCCIYNGKIIGVCSSNIIYNDGIEVNIKVNEQFRRNGIATALASYLILKCLEKNLKVSWDAANLNSVGLAKKLGFKLYGPYTVFSF